MEPLVRIAALVVATVIALLGAALAVVVGQERLLGTVRSLRSRTVVVAPYVLVLAAVLAVNKGIQSLVVDVSWALGYNATPLIYGVEGGFVAWLQASTPASLLVYFAAAYVVGYVFLLVFPLVGYLCLPSLDRLKQLLVAYGINYGVGLLLYALVVAYGPRNVMPDQVGQPLYELFPQVMLLTSAVNTNTNVFPSLHTSLSVTVLLFAWLTREEYPRWLPVAAVLATSVVLSTMLLGIHWLIDVVAGVGLAAISVFLSGPIVRRIDRTVHSLGGGRLTVDPKTREPGPGR